ncbi:MAG: arylsulfatase [Bacteroidota bacterium]
MNAIRLLLPFSLMLLLACQASTPVSEAPPNIIYILADDLGYQELGSYGQEKIQTPHLDQLAAEGMRFTRHYSGNAVCAPSRCVLLTGLHTGHSYVRSNYEMGGFLDEEEGGQLPLPPNTPTLACMLQAQGYATGAIGKWGLGGPGSTGLPTRQGFDEFYGYLCQKQAHNYYPTHLWRNESWDSLPNEYVYPHQSLPETADPNDPASYTQFRGQVHAQDAMAEEALSFVKRHAEEPFFLYLPFPIPHLALQAPEAALEPYRGQFPDTPYVGNKNYLPNQYPLSTYAAMITRMDQQIGDLLHLLDSLELAENTIVMFSSDNGTTFDIGGVNRFFFESLGELRGHKGNLYEGGIRVPFIARWPGHIPVGSTSALPSAFWDIWPTLAEITSGTTPPDLDGISLLPTLLGEQEEVPPRSLYWEYPARGGTIAIQEEDWKLLQFDTKEQINGRVELYHLGEDPGETIDLSAKHPEMVGKLLKQIQALHKPSEHFPLAMDVGKK